MKIHGKMRVVLEVDGNKIAESEDLGVCAGVLRLIGAENDGTLDTHLQLLIGGTGARPLSQEPVGVGTEGLAKEIGVPAGQLIGALDPSEEPPYLHVNKRYWEGLVSGMPRRGRGAVAPLTLILTILGVWKDFAKLGNATFDEGLAVLRGLGLDDKNKNRAVANCAWLINRGGEVALNPGMMSTALEVVRALCEKRAPSLKEKEQ